MESLIAYLSGGTPLLFGATLLVTQPSKAYSRVDCVWWTAAVGLAVWAVSFVARGDILGSFGFLTTLVGLSGIAVARWYWIGAGNLGAMSFLPGRPTAAACAVVVVASVSVALWVTQRPSQPAMDLESPIRGETWFVVQGGASRLVNHHASVPAQRYALDLTVVGDDGRRAVAAAATALTDFRAYRVPVVAPCAGVVVAAEDRHEDNAIGKTDRRHPAGNFVAVQCEAAVVVLAHLLPGSVMVGPGAAVAAGQQLGRIGNSGNSSEPHLHVHAIRGVFTTIENLLSGGEGVPVTIGERWPVRGFAARS